jgi:cytochrome P450
LTGFLDARYDDAFRKYHQLSVSILKRFGFGKGVMENRISVEVEELVHELKKADGQPVNPDRLITHCVLNVMSSIIFGKRYELQDHELEEILECINRFFYESMEIAPVSFFPPLRHLPSFRRKLDKILGYENVILKFAEQHIAAAKSGQTQVESFIKSFIDEEGESYDHEQLQYTLRDLLLAGSETSSTTLRWALLLLANHQDIQRRLQDEIDSVVPRDKLPSLDDRPKLPYVEATILEIWRNKTIVPLSVARATLSDTTVEGCFVPAGTTVCGLTLRSSCMFAEIQKLSNFSSMSWKSYWGLCDV